MGTRKKCIYCGTVTRTISLEKCKNCHHPFPKHINLTRTTAPAVNKVKGENFMNRFRKLLTHSLVLVVLSMLLVIAGCNSNPTTTAPTTEATTTAPTTEATTTAPTTEATTTAPTTEATTAETTANTIEVDGETIETFVSNPISSNGVYLMHDSDRNQIDVDLSQAIGFIPDEDLLVSDLTPVALGTDKASLTADFNTYLNTKINGFGELAGYTDGTNDYNQYYLHQATPQLPAYSWMVHTGFYIEMPGVGRLIGDKGRAVMILLINRTDKVYRFRNEPVTVIAGFQGWGRIWNGEPKEVIETEKRLVNHYLTNLGLGIVEKGFIGQTDQSYENATSVTVVTVERIQWGNNADGTPRYQFRLIRAETDPAIKK